MTPEQREALRRQFLDTVNELLNADDPEAIARDLYRPDSSFQWYSIENMGELLNNVNEQGWKPKLEKAKNKGGWLGCQISADELWLLPARPRYHQGLNARFLFQKVLQGEWFKGDQRYSDAEIIRPTDARAPIIFKSEDWTVVHKPAPTKHGWPKPRAGHYRKEEAGSVRQRRSDEPPDATYAARAREKAARIRAEEQAAVDREQGERTTAERADQLKLLEQVRALKRAYDDLETKRGEVTTQLEQARKDFPRNKLAKAVGDELAKLTPDQQKTLRDKKDYRLPSESTLPALARHREDAGRVRGELGFIEKRLPDGKALDAYLEKVGAMLGEGALRGVQAQEQELERRHQKFEGEDKTAYTQARRAREQEAATLLDGPIKAFFETRHERTHEYPTRMEEWDKEGLQQWLEQCQRTAKQQARER